MQPSSSSRPIAIEAVAPSPYTFDQYINRPSYILEKLYIGTYYTEKGVVQGAPVEFKRYAPPVSTVETLIKPHTELWNIYWEAFFIQVAPHLDGIKHYLNANETMPQYTRKENNGVRVASTSRTIIRISGTCLYRSADDESGYPKDLRGMVQLAESFGVVTDVHIGHSELHVSFSTPKASELFCEYLRQTGFRLEDGYTNVGGLNAFRVLPHTRDHSSRVLKLGPVVEIDLPYIVALFTEIFHGQVEYIRQEKYFRIMFADAESARFCHHVLHHSMFKVFGLALAIELVESQQDKDSGFKRTPWDVPYHTIRAV